MIEIPSEGTDNPVKAVLFYKKSKGKNQPPVVLTESEVNELVSINDNIIKLMHACSDTQ